MQGSEKTLAAGVATDEPSDSAGHVVDPELPKTGSLEHKQTANEGPKEVEQQERGTTRDQKLGKLLRFEDPSIITSKLRQGRSYIGDQCGSAGRVEPSRKLGAIGIPSSHSSHADGSFPDPRGAIEPMPTSSEPLPSPSPQPPLPGAYPQAGINRQFSNGDVSTSLFTINNTSEALRNEIDVDDFIHRSSLGEYSQSPRVTGDSSHNSEGLVEAMPVPALPTAEAQQVDPDMLSEQEGRENQRSTKNTKQQSCALGIAFLVAMVVMLVVIVLVVSRTNDTNAHSNSTSVMETPTAAPLIIPALSVFPLLPNFTQEIIRTNLETNTTSPQSQAYQWMQNDPMYDTYSEARLLQRYSLATLYYSTAGHNWKFRGGENSTVEFLGPSGGPGGSPPPGGPGGQPPGGPPPGGPPPGGPGGAPPGDAQGRPGPQPPKTFYSEEWLSYNTHECDWFNVYKGTPGQQICDEQGNLLKLDLLRNNLVGTLPLEIGLLSNLSMFKLRHNYELTGSLLPIASLSSLMATHINKCQLTGTLPTELAYLSNTLQDFGIMENSLSGTIPSELWKLSHLTILKLSKNQFTGTLPNGICDFMPNMVEFRADTNGFQGTLPGSLNKCSNLRLFEVGGNMLTGTLPTELGSIISVDRMTFGDNQFEGMVPSELGLLPVVRVIWFGGNPHLSGTLPVELENLNETLFELRLGGTSLTGTIPSGLCGIPRLEFDCMPDGGGLCGCGCSCD